MADLGIVAIAKGVLLDKLFELEHLRDVAEAQGQSERVDQLVKQIDAILCVYEII